LNLKLRMMNKFLIIGLLAFALPVLSAAQPAPVQESRVVIDGEYFYVHTIVPGETVYSLCRKYGITEQEMIRYNPSATQGVRAGETVRIPAPEPAPLPRNIRDRKTSNRQVEVHEVGAGETAYSLARYYSVSVDDLIESNPGLDPAHLSIGQTIRIPRRVMGSATAGEIEAGFSRYVDALSGVTPGAAYHLVQPGETLYGLSAQLGVSEETLKEHNPRELADGLKAGSLLKYPLDEAPAPQRPPTDNPFARPPASFDPETSPVYEEIGVRRIDTSRPLRVALLLPFTTGAEADNNMIGYYNGTLLALEELKLAGMSVDLSVFDTRGSVERVRDILEQPALERADLIIGPHEAREFEAAARFAYRRRIPIVSPQALVESDNPMVWQARPGMESRYERIRELLTPDKNILLIAPPEGLDTAFREAIEGFLPATARRVETVSGPEIRGQLSTDAPNVILVPTSDPVVADNILERISSVQNDYAARTGRSYSIQVIGSPDWYAFPRERVERTLFFKLRVTYATLYYADRADPAIAAFDDRYFETFGHPLPSRFAYRGYDVAKLFITAMLRYGDRFAGSIDRVEAGTLAPYRFVRDGRGRWVNDRWELVHYRPDYTVVTD
jgi:LysM repeat protein